MLAENGHDPRDQYPGLCRLPRSHPEEVKEIETNNEELQATNEELQTTNDELTARTMELQELTRQYKTEQSHLSSLLERFPHFVMVLNAENLTIQAVNSAYKQALNGRDVNGLPVTEVFSGRNVDELLKLLQSVARDGQSMNTGPIIASVGDGNPKSSRFVHTVVPITDASGSTVTRLFIYSEKVV